MVRTQVPADHLRLSPKLAGMVRLAKGAHRFARVAEDVRQLFLRPSVAGLELDASPQMLDGPLIRPLGLRQPVCIHKKVTEPVVRSGERLQAVMPVGLCANGCIARLHGPSKLCLSRTIDGETKHPAILSIESRHRCIPGKGPNSAVANCQ